MWKWPCCESLRSTCGTSEHGAERGKPGHEPQCAADATSLLCVRKCVALAIANPRNLFLQGCPAEQATGVIFDSKSKLVLPTAVYDTRTGTLAHTKERTWLSKMHQRRFSKQKNSKSNLLSNSNFATDRKWSVCPSHQSPTLTLSRSPPLCPSICCSCVGGENKQNPRWRVANCCCVLGIN